MAERIELFETTVAASVAIASPTSFALTMPEGVTRRVEILVPPGPSGLVGFRLAHSSQVIVPKSSALWVIADGEVLRWDLSGYPTGNKWSVAVYNLDVYPHTLYWRWFLDEIPSGAEAAPAVVAFE